MEEAATLVAVGAILFLLFLSLLVFKVSQHSRRRRRRRRKKHSAARQPEPELEMETEGAATIKSTLCQPSPALVFALVPVCAPFDGLIIPSCYPALFDTYGDAFGMLHPLLRCSSPIVLSGIQITCESWTLVSAVLNLTISEEEEEEDEDDESRVMAQVVFVQADGEELVTGLELISGGLVFVATAVLFYARNAGHFEVRCATTGRKSQTSIVIPGSSLTVVTTTPPPPNEEEEEETRDLPD